ncbi:hypothetical protein [Flavobacterium bomense]|uniref:hypothetical protein n=1 Tax=Flavobacterium bomense TaxID=2497483 RepID=UPI001F2114C8|nr:hypothetical protein [Flavobacterium bomense]
MNYWILQSSTTQAFDASFRKARFAGNSIDIQFKCVLVSEQFAVTGAQEVEDGFCTNAVIGGFLPSAFLGALVLTAPALASANATTGNITLMNDFMIIKFKIKKKYDLLFYRFSISPLLPAGNFISIDKISV